MAGVILPGCSTDIKFDIPELSGDNYKVWKERMLLQLGWMDLDYAIRKDEPPAITETSSPDAVDLYEKWEKSNRLSIMFIKTKICASIRGSIEQHTKVKDLLKAIDEQFATSNKALASTLIMQFSSLRLTEAKGVRDYITHMRDISAQPKVLKVTMSRTIKKESTCFFCKKKGHMKKDCPKFKVWKRKIPAERTIKKESTCFFCKKKGHMKKDCPKFKAWLKKKGYDKPKEANGK